VVPLGSEQSITSYFVCRRFAACPHAPICEQAGKAAARQLAGLVLVCSFVLIIVFPPVKVSDLRWRGNTN